MNYHLYPVSFKKYSLILVVFFFFAALLAWSMELYFERLYGDLTRAGCFSERDFGWQAAQPAISPELFKNYSIAEADVLVIGDSFSEARIWQTQLVSEGLKVSTMHWQDFKSNDTIWGALRSDLGQALRSAGFKGRYVIIESVERLFQKRMKALSGIHQTIGKTEHLLISNPHPYPQRERVSFNKLNGANWGINTLYNTLKLSWIAPKQLQSNFVRAVSFEGCQLFSHRLCQYAIFTDGDFSKETFNAIDNVVAINKSLQTVAIQAIWLIVPDKSTIYLGYGQLNEHPYQNIWQSFAQFPELIAPDLGAAFIEKSRMVKDFYLPNDTHLSTNGQLYFGELASQAMGKQLKIKFLYNVARSNEK